VAWLERTLSVSVLRGVQHLPAGLLDWPESALAAAVADARTDRAAAVHGCVRCGIEGAAGEVHDEPLCHGCAARELGIVH
jgi:hypothetical protein